MILSGSQSTWIEKNIINSTGFFSRISYQLTLEELSLRECNEFLNRDEKRISSYEKFKLLAVTGEIPRYLEEIQPRWSAEENVRKLCFTSEGLLFNEFDHIFSDLFSKRSEKYKLMVRHLVEGNRQRGGARGATKNRSSLTSQKFFYSPLLDSCKRRA